MVDLFFTLMTLLGVMLMLGFIVCAAFGLWIMILMVKPVIEATKVVAEAARRDVDHRG